MSGPSDSAALRGGLLHFDCAAGVAGDMTVGALVDLGVPESVIREALAAVPIDGYQVSFARVQRGALMGTKFRVDIAPFVERDAPGAHEHGHDHAIHVPGHPHEHRHQPREHKQHDEHEHDAPRGHEHEHEHEHDAPRGHEHEHDAPREHEHEHEAPHAHAHHGHHAHRHYSEIRALIERSALSASVRDRALAIFDRIARVESRLHGVSLDEVAFHEVGAVDSIVDIVGAAAALDWLRPARITSRIVALGHGSIHTAHGLLPIPTPATLEILAGAKVPAKVEDGGVPFELTTPTGAAILAASVAEYGAPPSMEITGVGWGAGDRELPDRPNLLRVIAGRPVERALSPATSIDRCVVLEANVDDMTPELVAPLIADLMAAGARDAWVTPLLMKKGRPGWLVSALCDPDQRLLVESALFRGSSTIGVRRHEVERTVLSRRLVEVTTPFGAVRVKVSGEGERENVAPELEDCARVAREQGVPLKRIHAEALAAWYRQG